MQVLPRKRLNVTLQRLIRVVELWPSRSPDDRTKGDCRSTRPMTATNAHVVRSHLVDLTEIDLPKPLIFGREGQVREERPFFFNEKHSFVNETPEIEETPRVSRRSVPDHAAIDPRRWPNSPMTYWKAS